MLILFVSLLSMCSTAAASDPTTNPTPLERGALPSIPVDVFAPREIKQAFVKEVFAEMDAIWRPAGITFTWRRVESKDAADPSRLKVAIEHGGPNPAGNHTTLGWIMFTGNEPEPSIHLSLAGVEDLLDATADLDNAATVRHELLIERALGRALSHELGHYLLETKVHTPRGLMRATWPPREIFAEARYGFELSADQRQSAVARLRSRATPAAAACEEL
jgi:hypothetical protein